MFDTQNNHNPQKQSMQLNQLKPIIKPKTLINQFKTNILFQESS